jgi:biopolymer transport protein ExbB/TolQ
MNAKRLSIVGIVIGALLALGPLWGFLLTGVSMMRAFDTLGKSGVADPKQLSLEIGNSLMATAAGLFIFPLGLVVLTVSIVFLVRAMRRTPPPLPPLPNP